MYKLDPGIQLPEYWDRDKVIQALASAKNNEEIVKFFECGNLMAFSRKMKPVFPDKPTGVPYLQYVRTLITTKSTAKPFLQLDNPPPKAELVKPRVDVSKMSYEEQEEYYKSL